MALSAMPQINLNASSDGMLSISLDAAAVARWTKYPLDINDIRYLSLIGGVIKIPTTEWGALNMEPLPAKTVTLLRLETDRGGHTLPHAYWFSSGLIPGYRIWTRYWNVAVSRHESRQVYQLYAKKL